MDDAAKLMGAKRSPLWGAVRNKFLKGKVCGYCGGTKKLQAHHIKPFHLYPELELDPKNLFPLCEGNPYVNCHLIFGHFGNFTTKFNLMVISMSRSWFKNLTAKKTFKV